MRPLVENTFLHLKGWQAIAARHAQKAPSFLATVQIRGIFLWGGIL